MSKINIRKIKNVECYDFETKTNIPYDEVIEVEKTKFIKQKLEENVLKEVKLEKEKDNQLSKDTESYEPPKTDGDEEIEGTEISEEPTEGGAKDDNSKGGKSKKKS